MTGLSARLGVLLVMGCFRSTSYMSIFVYVLLDSLVSIELWYNSYATLKLATRRISNVNVDDSNKDISDSWIRASSKRDDLLCQDKYDCTVGHIMRHKWWHWRFSLGLEPTEVIAYAFTRVVCLGGPQTQFWVLRQELSKGEICLSCSLQLPTRCINTWCVTWIPSGWADARKTIYCRSQRLYWHWFNSF